MPEFFARRFLERLQGGTTEERCVVVTYLGELYCDAEPGSEMQSDLGIAMVAVLDDPAPAVREALATAISRCAHLPRTVLLALSEDCPSVSRPILLHNPSLSEAWLVDLVGCGSEAHRNIVASRENIGIGICAALAELADANACLTMLRNPTARIPASGIARMVARHARDPELRQALLSRPDLPPQLRRSLVETLAKSLADYVLDNNLMSRERAARVFGEAEERALLDVSKDIGDEDLVAFADQLDADGALSVSMLLRALVDGRIRFFEAALSALSNLPLRRVRALLLDRDGRGFGAVYRRSGLAEEGFAPLEAAIAVLHEEKAWEAGTETSRRRIIERVLTRYEAVCGDQLDPFLAMLTRIYAEEARRAVRLTTGSYRPQQAA